MTTLTRPFALTAIATALTLMAGCRLGPDYVAPDAPKADQYTHKPVPATTASTPVSGGEAQTLKPGEPLPEKWWALFGSPAINGWVDSAFQQNPGVAGAQARLRQAYENVSVARASLFPSVTASLGATRSKSSAASSGGNVRGSIFNLYDASVDVSYQLDLFGGVQRGLESLRAGLDYQNLVTQGTYLTLAGNVVTGAISLASAQAQLDATQAIVKDNETTVELVQKQYQLGAAARADLITVQSQLAAVQAGVPALRQQVEIARNQLAVYTGRLPSEFDAGSLDLQAIKLPTEIPLTLPSELLKRRPDVAAAEAQLHQASANIGVATANQFPSLSLSASLGSQASQPDALFEQTIWRLAGNLTAPIFNAGRLAASKRLAVAQYDAAQADYRTVILNAFREVANALSALDNDAQGVAARNQAYELARENMSLTRKRYESGSVSLLQVVQAQSSEQQARISLVQALATRYADTAALFQALGGGSLEQIVTAAQATQTTPTTTTVSSTP